MPLAPYPKIVVTHAFRDFILSTNGKVSSQAWEERSLQYLVPWYPDNIQVERTDNGMILKRAAWFLQEFNQVNIDYKKSAIPQNVWEGIQRAGSYLKIDGNVQWYLDPYIHYFMENGLSQSSTKTLILKYPERKTDILFTALMMANALEKRQKSIFIHQAARHNLGLQF